MAKSIKNYTTSIKIEKTISEIEANLAEHGASSIYKMYSTDGVVQAIAFKIWVEKQKMELGFKLPMEEEKILRVLENSNISNAYKNIDQARRTGWRLIKHWIEAQMAMISLQLVKMEEVFLPYLYDGKTNQTLFEKLEKQNFKYQLEHVKEDIE